ncbi:MAG: hypothetical protein F4Z28_04880 [Gammaproteobacteria bacterium]|nr:hypothetical protein [Gammaproteobacteria bacterium]
MPRYTSKETRNVPDENNNNEELPAALVDALKADDRTPPVITAGVDHAVAAMARSHFRGRQPSWRRRGSWAALAACVGLIAVVGTQVGGPLLRDGGEPYGDVDGSGRVDIADVLALARSERATVTQADLDAFAMRVVSLNAGATR